MQRFFTDPMVLEIIYVAFTGVVACGVVWGLIQFMQRVKRSS